MPKKTPVSEPAPLDRLLHLRLPGQMPASREISAHLRALIKSGQLIPGTKIPSTKSLATAWGVFPNTVKLGLDPLVKEGLIDRRQNRGTYVLDQSTAIRRIGIYENFGSIAANDRDFLVSLQVELANLLEKTGAELKVWVDSRANPDSLPKNLLDACDKREIDGVVTSHPSEKILSSLLKLPVPVSALTSFGACPGRVVFKYRDLVESAVARLAERGARRIAVISNILPETSTEPANPQDVSRFYEIFKAAVAGAGLKTRSSWCIRPSSPKQVANVELFGYERMKRLWQQKELPDGLFMFPHTAARGCLTALMELGVAVPTELKVVSHGNIETPILTPYPVDWITSSSRLIVEAMLQQIQRALAGSPVKPVSLAHKSSWSDSSPPVS